jgi:translation initiation factor eIF-2B subunit epsilon
MPLFGQILAALYQDDIVEEEDIRRWHALPTSRGEGTESNENLENIKRCWVIGGHMIQQFDEQGDSSEEDTEQRQADVLEDKIAEDKTNESDEEEDEDEEEEEDDDEEEEEDEEDDDSEDEESEGEERKHIINKNDM